MRNEWHVPSLMPAALSFSVSMGLRISQAAMRMLS